MPKYFLYVRKSTDEATRQVLSLDAQVREMRALAKRDRLSITQYFEESRSAKAPGRPVFNDMVDRIARGEAEGILVWDIDRLYRNPVDEGRVRWMLQLGTITSIRTPTRSFFPADAGLLMAVEGGRAADFIIRHRRNVARGIEEKLLRGEWAGTKPLGYIYDHDKRNIVPDPRCSHLVKTVFEEVAKEERSLIWVSNRMAEAGVLTRNGRPWGKSNAHHFLANKLYMGIMVWGSETFEGRYEPLVSPEVFSKVAATLKIRSKPRKTRVGHNFPFCGLFRCTCGSMMSAQWAKGNGGLYRYSRCTRSKGPCAEKYVQEEAVIRQCLDFLKPLILFPQEANIIRELIEKESELSDSRIQTAIIEITTEFSDVQAKLNKLTRAYIDSVIDQESYDAAKADLILKKTELKKKKECLKRDASPAWIEPAKEVVATLELATKQQVDKSAHEISNVVRKTATNRRISGKKVMVQFASPYDFAADFLAPVGLVPADNELPHGTDFSRSLNWCKLVNHLRTHFS